MVHCPGCQNTISTAGDVTFEDMGKDSDIEIFSLDPATTQRYYVISCGQCNRMLGGSVAGMKSMSEK